jgi:microcin C transport system permease protein
MSSAEQIANLEEFPRGLPTGLPVPGRSVSLFRKRLRKFRAIKRGYYSFLIIVCAYGLSFFLPLLVNNEALAVGYHGHWYFPVAKYYPASAFDQQAFGEPDYRALASTLRRQGAGNWVLLPPYPYSPTESLLDLPGSPPNAPSR